MHNKQINTTVRRDEYYLTVTSKQLRRLIETNAELIEKGKHRCLCRKFTAFLPKPWKECLANTIRQYPFCGLGHGRPRKRLSEVIPNIRLFKVYSARSAINDQMVLAHIDLPAHTLDVGSTGLFLPRRWNTSVSPLHFMTF